MISNTPALSAGNAAIHGALLRAFGAVVLLNDAGTTIINISVRSGTPVLRIDAPPPGIEGVTNVSRPHGQMREEVRAARFLDCQIEWTRQVASRRNVVPLQAVQA